MSISVGDEVLVGGVWYPVDGYALTVKPGRDTSGDVFTTKPIGKFEPCLGYRINYRDVEGVRSGRAALAKSERKK